MLHFYTNFKLQKIFNSSFIFYSLYSSNNKHPTSKIIQTIYTFIEFSFSY